jgi:predicted nucleic acid-binding protein
MSENPLLAPIHGVTLEDYSAACAKMANGVSEAAVATALGVEVPVWQEANLLWPERMKQDETYHIMTLFGQYFGSAEQHPKLGSLQPGASTGNAGNTERIKNDKAFYEELEVARQVAYEYGIDGAQWIADEYGISLGDFQIAAVAWMDQIHKDLATNFEGHNETQAAYQEKYRKLFADAQGGNVADDISF